jgi:ZIP family zinc transporter
VNPSVWTVLLGSTVTALATGLGALPLLARRSLGPGWPAAGNSVAAGVMIGASLGLLWEAISRDLAQTALGAAVGVVALVVVRRALPTGREAHFGALTGRGAVKGMLILGVMTAHSFSEGVALGVAYGGGEALGGAVTFAIALHNVPEGLAISLVLVPRGMSVRAAAGWSVVSSLPQPLMAVPAFLLVEAFSVILPAGLGFAAGAMIWMAATQLIPEAVETAPRARVAGIATASGAAMLTLQVVLLG